MQVASGASGGVPPYQNSKNIILSRTCENEGGKSNFHKIIGQNMNSGKEGGQASFEDEDD